MGDWNFLGGILEEVHIHSTMVGKIWLTILFVFRMLVLGVATEDIWNDEQSDFICNTEQPGCRNVCYDQAFPISLIRFWVLQVLFVSSPSLVYMGHAIYQLRVLEKERRAKRAALRRELEATDAGRVEARRRVEREVRLLEQAKLNKAPLRGSLLRTYVAHVVARSAMEVGFMGGQYLLYGHRLAALHRCERAPCPNVVDCFVSRPTEKSVFMVFMQAIAAVSLCLSLLEVAHLGYKRVKEGVLDRFPHLGGGNRDGGGESKRGSAAAQQQVYLGASAGHGATIATTTSDEYALLLEKLGNGPLYPPPPLLLNASSAFVPIRGHDPPGAKPRPGSRKGSRAAERNSNSNNTSSETRSPPAAAAAAAGETEKPEDDVVRRPTPAPPHTHDPGDSGSLCPALLSGVARKPRRVSAPWSFSTVAEGGGSDSGDSYPGGVGVKPRCSFVGAGGGGRVSRAFSRAELQRLSRGAQSPEDSEAGELSSASQRSRDGAGPSGDFSPDRRASPASSGGCRRAPTDLQI